MRIVKRDGTQEPVSFDKVLRRIQKAGKDLHVQVDTLAQNIISQICDGISSSKLDELAAQLAASLSTLHPDYATLASRLTISNHHKNTPLSFAQVVSTLRNQTSMHTGKPVYYVSEDLEFVAQKFADTIEAEINYDRDYDFDYFGFKTLEKSYLLKDTRGRILERPQHMWMRVALGIWTTGPRTTPEQLKQAFETYHLMSQKIYTHATPTLFNAGTPRPQLSSCFLLAMKDDSIDGISRTVRQSPSSQVVLAFTSTMSVPLALLLVARMARVMALCQCSVTSMLPHATLTRVVASAMGPSPFTWSPGTQISRTS